MRLRGKLGATSLGALVLALVVSVGTAQAITKNYVEDFEHPFVGLAVFYVADDGDVDDPHPFGLEGVDEGEEERLAVARLRLVADDERRRELLADHRLEEGVDGVGHGVGCREVAPGDEADAPALERDEHDALGRVVPQLVREHGEGLAGTISFPKERCHAQTSPHGVRQRRDQPPQVF